MSDKIVWPKKGDNPFKNVSLTMKSPTWCSLGWLKNYRISDSQFAKTFKECANKTISDLEKGNEFRHPDFYFMPVAYLYRHSLELKLKHLIKLGINLELFNKNELTGKFKGILKDHKLFPLWKKARIVIERFWDDGPPEDLNAVESVINEFHKIDKSGQNLRYSEDTKGNKTVENFPSSVELTHMRDVFEATFSLLDACEMGFDNALDCLNEARSYY